MDIMMSMVREMYEMEIVDMYYFEVQPGAGYLYLYIH
jgi:hypothetical protein